MIALIGCVKQKRNTACSAQEMYTSPLFRKSYAYALRHAQKIYILSAKYGLLSPKKIISPYNETLNSKTGHEKKIWAAKVYAQMQQAGIHPDDEILFLCGENYCKYLRCIYQNSVEPLRGLPMGKRLKWLNESEETT